MGDSGRIPGLDPGGGEFASDGRYCVTMRRQRAILAMPATLDGEGEFLLPEGIVPFPRGFGFGPRGRVYLSSGTAPSGQGDNTIAVFDRSGALRTPRLVTDPELSPLDLKLAPNGNIVVASEWPFGTADAVASVREYDLATGQLVRVLEPERSVGFRRPRGLRFGPGGRLYCVGEDHVVAFDFSTGKLRRPRRAPRAAQRTGAGTRAIADPHDEPDPRDTLKPPAACPPNGGQPEPVSAEAGLGEWPCGWSTSLPPTLGTRLWRTRSSAAWPTLVRQE
jgi:hypothetical protein